MPPKKKPEAAHPPIHFTDATAADAPPREPPVFRMIRHGQLQPSNQNPRKIFLGLDELAASIRAQGVLETISVRPLHSSEGEEERFEIIAGERRWRASKMADVDELPCRVFSVSARQAFEIALEENGQRKDLTPLEEAEAYTYAVHAYGHSVEELAARTGHTVTHVRQRMRLMQLADGFRALLERGVLGVAAAVAMAAMPAEVQHEISRTYLERWSKSESAIGVSTIESVLTTYARPLDRAPFDTTDASLVAGAGACSTCPQRSGRQGELFDATGKADACLDDGCYRSKAETTFARRAEDAKRRGLRVLSEAESRAVIRWGHVETASEYAPRPGPDVEPTAIAQCQDTHAIIELVPAKVAKAAKKAAKAAVSSDSSKAAEENDPEAAARAERLELVRRTMARAAELASSAPTGAVAHAILERLGADEAEITKSVLGMDVATYATRGINEGTLAKVAVILARSELRIGPDTPLDETPPVLIALGLDLPEIAAEVREEMHPTAKPKPKAKGKPAAKAKAKAAAKSKAPGKAKGKRAAGLSKKAAKKRGAR